MTQIILELGREMLELTQTILEIAQHLEMITSTKKLLCKDYWENNAKKGWEIWKIINLFLYNAYFKKLQNCFTPSKLVSRSSWDQPGLVDGIWFSSKNIFISKQNLQIIESNWVVVTNSNFLITISLQPDGVNLWYSKLRYQRSTKLYCKDIGIKIWVCGKGKIPLALFTQQNTGFQREITSGDLVYQFM